MPLTATQTSRDYAGIPLSARLLRSALLLGSGCRQPTCEPARLVDGKMVLSGTGGELVAGWCVLRRLGFTVATGIRYSSGGIATLKLAHEKRVALHRGAMNETEEAALALAKRALTTIKTSESLPA